MVDTSSLSGVMASSGYTSSDSSNTHGGVNTDSSSSYPSYSDDTPARTSGSERTQSPHPQERTSSEQLAQTQTSFDALASSPTTTESLLDDPINPSPLTGPAAMALRREFNHVPLNPSNAYNAYRNLGAGDFAGPDDMRLAQLSRTIASENDVLQAELRNALPSDVSVTGRAKTPFSTYGKLIEDAPIGSANASTLGDIRDLSGLRVDVTPQSPNFRELYDTQARVNDVLGPDLALKQDYIAQPNNWGYTGRVHSILTDSNGLAHEVQVGTPDITQFIDGKLTTPGGDRIPLHDVTGFKGDLYGTSIPDNLQSQYAEQLTQITETNRTGQVIADVPSVQTSVNQYVTAVQDTLPDRLNTPPAPDISTRAQIGNIAGRSLGPLDIVGGGFQAANGVQTWRSGGDRVEASVDVAAGTTSIVSGAAITTGRVALGTTTGGVVATLDGARDIYTGIRDGDVEQTVVGTVKAGAGTAMLAGVATANPVLIAGGAIAYGGAVVYESRDAIASGAKRAWNWLTGG